MPRKKRVAQRIPFHALTKTDYRDFAAWLCQELTAYFRGTLGAGDRKRCEWLIRRWLGDGRNSKQEQYRRAVGEVLIVLAWRVTRGEISSEGAAQKATELRHSSQRSVDPGQIAAALQRMDPRGRKRSEMKSAQLIYNVLAQDSLALPQPDEHFPARGLLGQLLRARAKVPAE